MFNRQKHTPTGLDLVIKLATDELEKQTPGSPEYDRVAVQLERLYKIKTSMKVNRVSWDALIATFGNLVGIGLIIKHEQLNVITSKALGFVMKSRV